MMLAKRLCMINCLSNSMLLILRYQVLVDYSLILISKVLSERLKILSKRYPILMRFFKKTDYSTKIKEIENKITYFHRFIDYCCSQNKHNRDWKQNTWYTGFITTSASDKLTKVSFSVRMCETTKCLVGKY